MREAHCKYTYRQDLCLGVKRNDFCCDIQLADIQTPAMLYICASYFICALNNKTNSITKRKQQIASEDDMDTLAPLQVCIKVTFIYPVQHDM